MTIDVARAARLVAHAAVSAPAQEVPRRVCAAVCEGLDMDGATLSLLTDTPSRQLLAASDDAALLLEEIQFTVLEGPCVSAARTGAPVALDDLSQQLTPWPLFGAALREKLPQVKSLYALPVFFGDYVLGTVDLLALRPHALGKEELEQAADVADAISAALMPIRDVIITGAQGPAWAPEDVVRAHWFDTARAVGALMARRGLTREDALAVMRAQAFRTGRSLVEITTDILHERPDSV